MTRWGAVLAVALSVVLAALDLTAVVVALPVMGEDLGAGPTVTQWVLHAYNLPMVALSIPAGRWLDRAGHRPAFLLSVVGFGVASLAIALAPTAGLVLAGRAVQGLFSALIGAVTMPVIGAAVHPRHRGRAMSLVLTLIPVSGVAGPALGGVLTDTFGWRSVFLINVPVVLVAVLVGLRTIPRSERGLPWPGRRLLLEAAVVGVGATALFVHVYLAPVAVLALVVWLRLPEARPVRDMLRRPRLGPALAAMPLIIVGIAALNFVVPYLIADRPAVVIGLAVLSMSAGMAVFSPVAGVLADRFGAVPVAAVGAVVALVGTALLLPVDATTPTADLVWRLAVLGVGHGLFAGPNAAAILAETPPDLVGTSGGLTSLLRTLGFSAGPALGAAIGAFTPTVVALLVVTALGITASAAQLRWSHRADDLPLERRAN
ncbi:MFS transporter [Saccharothrix mutabilis subsp. mutabilis]|uniref:MFS transporter n=1 Tax=Saccharothrix mutabilis subsp. mutabilis TaxID=66855 RepID=A0ABP3DZA6_9PSEU